MNRRTTLTLERVHAVEYRLPLKRQASATSGRRGTSATFIVMMHGSRDDQQYQGIGECQPRRHLTGDKQVEDAWDFLLHALESLEGWHAEISSAAEARDAIRRTTDELRALALQKAAGGNADKPFRGTLLGIELALLDLASTSLGLPISAVLGTRRERAHITTRTLMKQESSRQLRQKVRRQAHRYPTVRVLGHGDHTKDIRLLETVHATNRSTGTPKPIWIDLGGRYEFSEAKELIEDLITRMSDGSLPLSIMLERPVAHEDVQELTLLQQAADDISAQRGTSLDLRIAADASVRDVGDLERLLEAGGCRAIIIKPAKAGGLLESLDMAETAVGKQPDVHICIGGLGRTSHITAWANFHLTKALPRVDQSTAGPPQNIEDQFTAPPVSLEAGTNLLTEASAPGLGAHVDYPALFPRIHRHAWFPPPPAISYNGTIPNVYAVDHLRPLGAKELDNHLLERESLALGLGTKRFTPLDFLVADERNPAFSFSWTRSTVSARSAVGITSDKHSTRLLLQRAGIPVPRGRRFPIDDRRGAARYAEHIGYPVVLKPLRGTGGTGVITGIATEAELDQAFDSSTTGRFANQDVIVEEHIHGSSHRIFVLNDQVLSVRQTEYGTVIGDGRLPVAELMLQKHSLRMQNPHLMNRKLKVSAAARQVARQGLDLNTVPRPGQVVVLTPNANAHQGGETIEVLDDTHPSILEACVRALGAIPGLAFTGLDFILSDHRLPLSDQTAAICEINGNPSQASHHYALYGSSHNVSQAVVQLCAQAHDTAVPAKRMEHLNVLVEVAGRVRGVGYREWLRKEATGFGLTGWVQHGSSRAVEALIHGPTDEVAALVSRCIRGPSRARPETVETTHSSIAAPATFTVR